MNCLDIAKLIEDEIDRVIEAGGETDDLFGDLPSCLEIDGAYALTDNSGFFILKPSSLRILHDWGFVVHEDVVYDPKKWTPVDSEEGYDLYFMGHDGIIIPKSRHAKSFCKRFFP